jgi:hypothetical protein
MRPPPPERGQDGRCGAGRAGAASAGETYDGQTANATDVIALSAYLAYARVTLSISAPLLGMSLQDEGEDATDAATIL